MKCVCWQSEKGSIQKKLTTTKATTVIGGMWKPTLVYDVWTRTLHSKLDSIMFHWNHKFPNLQHKIFLKEKEIESPHFCMNSTLTVFGICRASNYCKKKHKIIKNATRILKSSIIESMNSACCSKNTIFSVAMFWFFFIYIFLLQLLDYIMKTWAQWLSNDERFVIFYIHLIPFGFKKCNNSCRSLNRMLKSICL